MHHPNALFSILFRGIQKEFEGDGSVSGEQRTCTPGWVSCMNSKSLFTTVFRNFQWARRKRGYCPTTYMMLLAITACRHKHKSAAICQWDSKDG
jgi:hypothetical protein